MKLTDITTILELAKELKEVGFPQKSLFYWYLGLLDGRLQRYIDFADTSRKWNRVVCSAPTAEELLEWLPKEIVKYSDVGLSEDNKVMVVYDSPDGYTAYAKTYTEALAKMVIYLAKNKIINFER